MNIKEGKRGIIIYAELLRIKMLGTIISVLIQLKSITDSDRPFKTKKALVEPTLCPTSVTIPRHGEIKDLSSNLTLMWGLE